jgi:hypothetical protein
MGRVGDVGGQAFPGRVIEATRRGGLEARPVRVLDEDGGHRWAQGPCGFEDGVERRLEVVGRRDGAHGKSEGVRGIAGRSMR